MTGFHVIDNGYVTISPLAWDQAFIILTTWHLALFWAQSYFKRIRVVLVCCGHCTNGPPSLPMGKEKNIQKNVWNFQTGSILVTQPQVQTSKKAFLAWKHLKTTFHYTTNWSHTTMMSYLYLLLLLWLMTFYKWAGQCFSKQTEPVF